jgi:hypothetical protein
VRRDARILKRKAVASLRRAAAAFNGLDDEGRHTTVLIHLQHAFEMLLKAALHEKRATIVDAVTGQSVGFKKCLNLATAQIPLRAEDAGTLRAIDQLRDDEYHYLGLVSEGILYLHLRAAISIFDRILQEVFGETLADQLPARVLPISTQPPEDLQVLIDREYTQVRALLSPGHRQGPEARARIRTLLALEGHVAEDAEVRNSDVTRVERAVRGGSERAAVFPRLENLTSQTLGLEVSIKVHTTRREGAPVRFVADGEPGEAGAVRDVDLQARYPFSKTELAQHVKLTAPKTAALRAHLQIDGNAEYHHQFTFGHMTHDGYSHAALRAMREVLEGGLDMDAVWAAHRTRRRP